MDGIDTLNSEFTELLDEIRQIYKKCAHTYIAEQQPDDPVKFLEEMENLYRGLCLKIYLTIAWADKKIKSGELRLAQQLYEALWNRRLDAKQTRLAIEHQQETMELRWESVLKPFATLRAFRTEIEPLELSALRLAQLVAQTKDPIGPEEARDLKWIGLELHRILYPIASRVTEGDETEESETISPPTTSAPTHQASAQQQRVKTKQKEEYEPLPVISTKGDLDSILKELDGLIGLDIIKKDVRELINFLKMQEQRKEHDLPTTPMSLHAVFTGNPGTGKTTVARIYGRILGAMGILKKGHLIETDRGGLVAEFAGQTAGKTAARVDEALDGVLFIDEAYSLVAEGEDPYGAEAVQTLLKRMEDQRDRLVVIIAGYPDKMKELLETNPGLSSRFGRTFHFPDYTSKELGQIFGQLCSRDAYSVDSPTRAKLLLGFEYLWRKRDEHFGNGRLVRNIYEATLRFLANRLAFAKEITRDMLTRITSDDVSIKDLEPAWQARLTDPKLRFRVDCLHCKKEGKVSTAHLGQSAICPGCKKEQVFDWATPEIQS